MPLKKITPNELQQKLCEDSVTLIDVREPHELEICTIDEAVNIPMSEIETRFEEIPRDNDVVVMCRSGGRSSRAIEFLELKGYANLTNLEGGILAWIDDVNSNLEKY